MSSLMKQSLINLLLWLFVGIFFLSIFLSGNTVTEWGENTIETVTIACLFGFGFIGQIIASFIIKKKKNEISKDERDEYVQLKAMPISFIITVMYIFILAISLYLQFETAKVIPVAWMWFLAYSLIVVANVSSSSISIYYYWRSGK